MPIVVLARPDPALGFGLAPKVLIVALVCFFPVTVNLYDGLQRADPDQPRRAAARDALADAARARAAERAAAAFTGVRIAAAVAVIGAVFAEWRGSSNGLGHALLTAIGQLATARAFAATAAVPARHRPLRRVALLERR